MDELYDNTPKSCGSCEFQWEGGREQCCADHKILGVSDLIYPLSQNVGHLTFGSSSTAFWSNWSKNAGKRSNNALRNAATEAIRSQLPITISIQHIYTTYQRHRSGPTRCSSTITRQPGRPPKVQHGMVCNTPKSKLLEGICFGRFHIDPKYDGTQFTAVWW